MKRPTRVLHVIQNLNYGGMERVLADLVRGVDPARVESHVLCLQYLGRYSQGLEERARLHVAVPMPRWSMLHPSGLARQIAAITPDVVHAHSGVWYKASRAASMAGVPLMLYTEHGRPQPDPWRNRALDRLAAARTHVVAAVSAPVAGRLVPSIVARADKVRVIENGVDTALFHPRPDHGELRADLGIAPDAPVIGSIGRLERIKGFDVMVEGFAHLARLWPGGARPVLVLAGEGAEREGIEARARELGVWSDIRFLGWRDDVHRLHALFDLFTLASRSEGTSISILEAMSAGLCPVVTDVGGNANVLGPELRHLLVPSEDPQALARGWLAALTDPGRRAHDSERARARVVRAFSVSRMVDAYDAVYAESRAGRGVEAPVLATA